jgi:hypothetical protein
MLFIAGPKCRLHERHAGAIVKEYGAAVARKAVQSPRLQNEHLVFIRQQRLIEVYFSGAVPLRCARFHR